MPIEIEAKLQVESFDAVERSLEDAQARFAGEVTQEDHYYDDPLRALEGGDRCLRLRTESGTAGQRTILCYKGPRLPARYKVRDELQVVVMDRDAIELILEALGYRRSVTVRKCRRIWRLAECQVCLDQVEGVGHFVEIEGPNEGSVARVQEALDLAGLQHISTSYASMVAAKARST